MAVRILRGDCLDVLKTLPDESVHCCVTSPPYYGLRDYGVAGQLGLEPTLAEYVSNMVAVFREVRRVLRNDGTLWLNIGDSYNAAGRDGHGTRVGYKQGTNRASDTGSDNCRPSAEFLKPKDLMGVPWRLAFALQAPDYLGRIQRETDRAWLAALIDGEGCITILESSSPHGSGSSYPPILQVRMCDRECIDKAMQLVGSESDNPAQYPPSMEGQRPAFHWRIHGRKAADTIAEIYPFLLIKRKQAVVAWNHQAVRDGYTTKRGVKIPEDALAKQIACREMIQRLNRREPVDIPSWMIEPPQPVGPGWYLRQDVIWSKPNPMPESVRDRCTKSHEYIFLLSKSAQYFYDFDAVQEQSSDGTHARLPGNARPAKGQAAYEAGDDKQRTKAGLHAFTEKQRAAYKMPDGWATHDGGHGAFHKDGREKGAPAGRDVGVGPNARPRKGAPNGSGTKNNPSFDEAMAVMPATRNPRSVWTITTEAFKEAHFATFPAEIPRRAITAGCPKGGTVLDPFGGAGTTGLVADRLQRDAILIELNPAYADMAERRIRGDSPLFAEVG